MTHEDMIVLGFDYRPDSNSYEFNNLFSISRVKAVRMTPEDLLTSIYDEGKNSCDVNLEEKIKTMIRP